jgi:CubicO group peptidase (beta-lactamase class C family)
MRKRLPALLLGLLLAAALFGCSHPKSQVSKPPAPQNIEELKKAISEVLARTHTPGVGIALVNKDGVTWTGGVGKADLATGRDVDGDTMFRIGSITKGFVALSFLQLQEKGKISLDTKVLDVALEVQILNPHVLTDPVHIANLLEHTAGFDDFPLAEFYSYDGRDNIPLIDTLQKFPHPLQVRWRPGMFYSYSNPGYGVAGYVLEKVTGQPCEDYIAANILRPLGMAHSDLRLTPTVKAALAQGYEYNPPRPVPYLPILLRSAGEMKSSPNEMARFVRMMLNRGSLDGVTIVSPDSITRMETPKTTLASRNGLKYGYGLGNVAHIWHPFIAHGHNGGLDGFLSDYEYLPEQGVGYFFSINSSAESPALNEIGDLLFAYITRGMTPPAKPAGVALDSRIENATGMYQLATPRSEWTRFITELFFSGWTYIDKGELFRRGLVPGTREKMIYLGDGQIRVNTESAASGVYCKGPDGESYGTGALATFQRVNPVWPVIRFVIMVMVLLLMATSLLFAIVWVPRKLLGRMRGVQHLWVRGLPLLASLTLLAIFLRSRNQPAIVMGRPDSVTITIYLLTILFPALSVAALVLAARPWQLQMSRVVRVHSLLVAIACCTVSWYFAYWGLIGARVWAL